MNLYKDYDPQTLRRLQELERMILRDFDEFCTLRGIHYFADGGTCLGAVRHRGFIPWDDDIDIGMNRRDYEHFLKAMSFCHPEKYRFVNPETDPGCPFVITRMILKDTEYVEECFRDVDYPSGIFIDIFCYDNAADNPVALFFQGWTAWFWGKLYILRFTDKPVLYFSGRKADVFYAIFRAAHRLLAALPIPSSFYYKRAMKASRRYEYKKTSRVALFFDPMPFMGLIKKSKIYPTRRLSFDGMRISCPGKTDAYLRKYYGNYMQIPPKEQRHNHPPYRLDFGKYKIVEGQNKG